jgi:hypothetical protein
MALQTRDQLKQWFETSDYPTQQQFWDWLDSFVHQSEFNITGIPDDLPLVVGVDVAADLTEVVVAALENRRFRIFRNNTKMFDWTYKLNGLGVRIGFILGASEAATIADEKFIIEFY